MNQIEVHTYSDPYNAEIGNLIVSIQQAEFNIPITLVDQPDLNNIRDFYQVGNGNFWVATVDGQVAGTIALLDIGNGLGALRKMFVKEQHRGKAFGLGQLLLNTLLQWARHKEFSKVYLGTTEKFKAAQRFYEKNGFQEISKDQLPKEFPIMKVDVKFYVYHLVP
jgi:N-acetylglutamate synthase-like GNAT family acetyltransferase